MSELSPNPQISVKRQNKIRSVLAQRQKDLTLVLNHIHDYRNVSAIFRTCDAFGLNQVHLLYPDEEFPFIGPFTSGSASKWVDKLEHNNSKELITHLKSQGMQCIGTALNPSARPLQDWDYTQPTAIIMGNEHAGMDADLYEQVDGLLYIPMFGMVQSFNVAVAASLILYEASRQRQLQNAYNQPTYSEAELESLFQDWCARK